MAFGALKGTLANASASQVNPTTAIDAGQSVSVGDLIYVVFGQQTNLTVGTGGVNPSDNLGNTYTWCNAGDDPGVCTARAAWSVVTTGGTLTSISVAATASTNDYANVACIIEGPFKPNASQPAANPANTTGDITSPFACPSTGTLPQALCAVLAFYVCQSSQTFSATSPNLLARQASSSTNIKTVVGYQAVNDTSAVAPEFTVGTNPANTSVLGTTAFAADNQYISIGQPLAIYDPVVLAEELGQFTEPPPEADLTQGLTPGLIAADDAFHAPTVAPGAVDLTPGLVTTDDAFYAPTVGATYGLTPGLVASDDAFYAPTVAAGAVDLQPGLVGADDAFHVPTVAPGAVDLQPGLVSDADTFHVPTVSLGANDLQPGLIGSDDTFHVPTVSATADLTPGLYDEGDTFYAPTVSATYDLQPGLIGVDDSFYGPNVTATADIAPSLFAADDLFYSATVGGGEQPGVLTPIDQTLAIHDPRVFAEELGQFQSDTQEQGPIDLQPALFVDGDTFHVSIVEVETISVTAILEVADDALIEAGEGSIEFPPLDTTQGLAPGLFSYDDTFYVPTVSGGAVDLQPGLYSDGDTFYLPTITQGTIDLIPGLFSDSDVFYSPTVTPGPVDLSPGLYTDAETFYAPVTLATYDLQPGLFVDSDTVPAPTSLATFSVQPGIYADADVFHSPSLSGGNPVLLPDLFVDQDEFYGASIEAVVVRAGGGPAFGAPRRKRKKRLDEIIAGLNPVIAKVKKAAAKPEIDKAAVRAIQRARSQYRLDEFTEQVNKVIAQRREYDRAVVLAAIAAQRVMRMEEEEAVALLLLAA